jgi:hypothetical protein
LTWVGLEVSAAIALTNEGVGIIDAIDKALSEELKALLSLIIAFWFGNRSLEKLRG